MVVSNYSAEPLSKLYSWLPHDLKAAKVIFFPDACPGKSPLPTGTVVFTSQPNWRKFAISDCGCGMLFCEAKFTKREFLREKWDKIFHDLRANKNKLGDLGSGNHFLDALIPTDREPNGDERVRFLIHTGSRNESNLVDDLVDHPEKFDETFESVCNWAKDNRFAILKLLEKYFGPLEVLLDRNHNHFERMEDGVVIRKGAVKVLPGEQTVIPSSINGDVVLVSATQEVANTFNSLCHGTGRVMSRSEAKELAGSFDFAALRRQVYIPPMISNDSLRSDTPPCYRDLDQCLALVEPLLTVERRFRVFAYLGQM